jgi:hypothetical protein
MAPTEQEAGLVTADGIIHAAVRNVSGHGAACGAGRIVRLVVGRFDPDAPASCRLCAQQASAQSAECSLDG